MNTGLRDRNGTVIRVDDRVNYPVGLDTVEATVIRGQGPDGSGPFGVSSSTRPEGDNRPVPTWDLLNEALAKRLEVIE